MVPGVCISGFTDIGLSGEPSDCGLVLPSRLFEVTAYPSQRNPDRMHRRQMGRASEKSQSGQYDGEEQH